MGPNPLGWEVDLERQCSVFTLHYTPFERILFSLYTNEEILFLNFGAATDGWMDG